MQLRHAFRVGQDLHERPCPVDRIRCDGDSPALQRFVQEQSLARTGNGGCSDAIAWQDHGRTRARAARECNACGALRRSRRRRFFMMYRPPAAKYIGQPEEVGCGERRYCLPGRFARLVFAAPPSAFAGAGTLPSRRIASRLRARVFAPMPLTWPRSSTLLNGPWASRYATMALALLRPMPSSEVAMVWASALLTLTGVAAIAGSAMAKQSASAQIVFLNMQILPRGWIAPPCAARGNSMRIGSRRRSRLALCRRVGKFWWRCRNHPTA